MADDPEGAKSSGPTEPEDQLPDDIEALRKLIREERKKFLQAANDRSRERKTREAMTEKMKIWLQLEEAGHTPDEIKQLLEQRSEAEVAKAKETGNIEKLIANARRDAEKRAEAAEARAVKAEGMAQRKLIDEVIMGFLEKYGVEPRLKKALFAMIRPRFQTVEDPSDEYGMRPVVMVGEDFMDADEWIKQQVETDQEWEPFLKASLATGGGAIGANGAGARMRIKDRKSMSALEKSQYIRAHGIVAYNQLPWERGAA